MEGLNKIEPLIKEINICNKMNVLNKNVTGKTDHDFRYQKIYPAKTCDKCNLTIGYKTWSAHLKSIRHQKNDPDQTIIPCRLNTKYKGIPINQYRLKNFNFLKLMQNNIKKSIKNNKCYVKYCAFKYYENSNNIKYNLNEIPINGNIFIINQGDDCFGNGNSYISKLLHSPTWLELCQIANDLIITTGDYTHRYLEEIRIVQDLGKIIMCEFFMGS